MTNVGTRILDKEGKINGLDGRVYYDPESIANIFSFSKLAEQYHVTYDNNVEDAFTINIEGKQIKFEHSPEGLYYYNVGTRSNEKQLISTVAENRGNFSTQQYKRAKVARKWYHNIGM
jgi:hypothetical protein